jgi:hypothetical protein
MHAVETPSKKRNQLRINGLRAPVRNPGKRHQVNAAICRFLGFILFQKSEGDAYRLWARSIVMTDLL